ncbi:CD1375 family protein [Peribacillus aracenensis]|nr:CD1375 family protein [Peribacillus sp. BBB004]
MAKLYYDLINKGLRAIEDVPIRWREDSQALLDADQVTV